LHKAIHNGNWDFVYNTDGLGRRVSVSNPASNGNLLANDDWEDPLNRFLSTDWLQQRILRASLDREASVVITDSNALADTLLPGLTPNPQQPLREIVHALTPPGPDGGWTAWSITGTLEGGGDPGAAPDRKAKLAGLALFPPAEETFTYDDAGNRSSSARWNYTYDGLNRLTRAVNKDMNTAPEAWDVEFTYDAEGRRHSKTSKLYRDGALKDTTITTWIWDGWHPVIERLIDAKLDKPIVERKLVWGPDLSGQPGGAGGAGGLLLIRETNHSFDGRPPVITDLLPLYDGSGNIVGLANPEGDLLAEYWYGPFGELLEATGSHAGTNPWRWASKSLDPETGLVYFGLRYYDSATGQWLSREPLGEGESLNLYAYCHNDPINRVDVLGAAEYDKVPTGWKVEDGKPMVQYTTYLLPWHNWITGSHSVVSEGWEPATQAQRNQGWKFHYNDGWKLGPEPALQQQMAAVGENMKGGPEFCQTLLVGSWTSVAAAPLIVPLATVEGGSSAYVLAANGARAAWTHGDVRLAGYLGMGAVGAGTGYGLATDQNFRGEFITAEMATGLPGEGLLLFGRGLQMAGRDARNWMQGFDYFDFASRANARSQLQLFPQPLFVVPQNQGLPFAATGATHWGNPKTLADHFGRHGADFGAKIADDYMRMASDFFRRSQAERLPTKIAPDGKIRVYDPKNNIFGSYNPSGTTKTFYKPDPAQHKLPSILDYWNKQPGVSPWQP
jgi:RHS repeat-associated protein